MTSFDVTSSPALSLTSSVPFTLPLSYPLAFLLVLPHAKHDLIFAPPCSPFFLSKMPPDPRYLDYVLPYFIWSLLKWYLLRGPSLTTTSKIVFPNLLPCFIFPHSIYNLIYMFINLFIYAPPSFALNSVKAGPGFFLFFMNPHKGAQNC